MSISADVIDHTILDPMATRADIERVAQEALELATASVCVNGAWVATAASIAPVVCAVVGFPLGAGASAAKAGEALIAVASGALEIDMVINLGALIGGESLLVRTDIEAVRAAIGSDHVLKVIIEAAALDDDQIRSACLAAVEAGADFVKTSTGFHASGGASIHAVELMRATVGSELGVKASGGIRTRVDAEAMLAAGATRLGLSSTVAILSGG